MSPIPDPTTLDRTDPAQRALHLCVLAVGAESDAFVEAARASLGANASPNVTREGDPSVAYASAQLGEIRGWTAHVHIFGLGGDPRIVPNLQRFAGRADGFVIAEPASASSPSDTMRALAEKVALAAINAPTAVYANEALGRQWNSLTDRLPVSVSDASAENAGAAIKAIAKVALASFRRPESMLPPA
jgi:hypothetical protein